MLRRSWSLRRPSTQPRLSFARLGSGGSSESILLRQAQIAATADVPSPACFLLSMMTVQSHLPEAELSDRLLGRVLNQIQTSSDEFKFSLGLTEAPVQRDELVVEITRDAEVPSGW